MALLGVFGYVTERRKGGGPAARGFLLWYALAISFVAFALCGTVYPKLHWLYYLAGAMAVVNALVQLRRARRAHVQARAESSEKRLGPGKGEQWTYAG
jgi:hypothetical protein